MTWGEYIDFETMDAKAEAIIETRREDLIDVLNELGSVSNDLLEKVNTITDADILKKWFMLAIKVDSMEAFMEQM
ncbi:MAG: hypothetical protein IIX48_02115 [Lachnospiraceae bacterium]|nr:hypothetical protein [Lachnospiraceae bacterium]